MAKMAKKAYLAKISYFDVLVQRCRASRSGSPISQASTLSRGEFLPLNTHDYHETFIRLVAADDAPAE
jgi:hypothetical protein